VCKLFGPAYKIAATMEVSVNSLLKTWLFVCDRHIFKDHQFACYGMDEFQDKLTDGSGSEISRQGKSKKMECWIAGIRWPPAQKLSETRIFPCCQAVVVWRNVSEAVADYISARLPEGRGFRRMAGTTAGC
jgi:hypothetical protein